MVPLARALLLACVCAGCGSRTGLLDLEARDRPDAGTRDAGPPDAAPPPPDAAPLPDAERPREREPAVMVAAGLFHTCAATRAGRVHCWGHNNQGQVGDGTTATRLDPTPSAGIGDAVSVAAGREHTCALLAAGRLVCWGANLAGQVGDDSFDVIVPSARRVALPAAVQVSAGGTHTCARVEGDRLYCWGDNAFGQVGPSARGTYRAPIEVPLGEPVLEVSAGFQHTCALVASRRVLCWGQSALVVRPPPDGSLPRFAPRPVPGLPPVDRLASGDYDSCAVDEASTAWCWSFRVVSGGFDGRDEVVPDRAEPVSEIGAVAQIALGHEFRCAVDLDGRVTCWGNNDRGQLGDGGADARPGAFVTPIGLPETRLLGAGWRHACALAPDGVVRCWGRNWEGQLGDGTGGEHRPPVVAGVFR
ncbi:MAG: hypothetical protein KF729_13270 [Sandaracinaceae bacterium]|nr:hypothetical protein [Sandaracinaceae bacterium]